MSKIFTIARFSLLIGILMLTALESFGQTTYYSRNGATAPRNWDEADSWTLNSDGSGPAAAIPGRSDHVVILAGHNIIIDNVADNGSAGISADALGDPLVGSFTASNIVNFYQTGDILIEAGGTLTTTTRLMVAGSTFVFGDLNVGGDLTNLGDLVLAVGGGFDSGDDLIISGTSTTRVDTGLSFTDDDLYIDHTQATLCGIDTLDVGNANIDPRIQYFNGATSNQICSGFVVTGCVSCPVSGTGPFPPGPSLTGSGGTISYTENAVVIIDPAITVTYTSGPFLTSATISISANYVNGEGVLDFTPSGSISGSFDAGTGVLTLSGYGTAAEWQAILRSVTYENLSDNPTISTRTLSITVSDGYTNSNTVSRDLDITAVNDPPDVSTISGTPTPLVYTENDGAVAMDDQITVDDPDDTDFESAVISISNFQAGEDVIGFVDQNGITGTIVGNTLSLTGTATLAEYQTALRSITYENTSDDPVTTTRTVSFTVNDGDANSIPFTRDINIISVNDAPIITSTAPTTATEDVLYTYTAVVNDPDDANDGTNLTWSLSGEPAGMTVSSTGVVTWTPGEGVLTSGAVTLTVADGGENGASPDTEVFTITVTPVNDPPTITTTAPTTATEDVIYTYAAGVSDPDDANNGTDLTWSLSGEPAGMVVSTTGVVTWTPAEGVTTSGSVTLTVADGGEDGASPDTEVFTITVTQVNDPPVITTTAPTTATEDILYTYTAGVNDPDDANNGTDLLWTLSGEPAGMVVSSTGEVTWTPGEGVLTSGSVTLTVADGGEDGASPDTEVFTITVTPVNDPPVITTTAPTTATEDILYTYTAGVSDPDDANNGTDLLWTLSGEPAGMTVSTTGVVSWTPGEGVLTSGSVTLTVADGGEDGASPDSEVFTISVTPVNDPPVITTTAPTTATEDVLYTYTAGVSDPDDANNGTDLNWSLSGEPAGMVVSTTGVVTWTPGEGVLTSGSVTLTVADGGEDGASPDTEVFTITVTPVNDPPVITTTAPTTATEDILYTYTAGVSDPDDANNGTDLLWTLSGEPVGMTVSTTGVVSWTPGEGVLTSGSVTLTVADGGEDGASPDSEVFTISVTPVNDPPVITTTAPTTATEDVLYTYTAGVSDPDDANNGTDLLWTLSGEPTGMVVSSTGEITWTPGEGVTTSGSVTLTVTDGGEDGATPDSEVFTITVTPVNDPPVITTTAPTTATEDILYTYTAGVSDPDDANNGTDLLWTLSGEPAGMTVSTTGVVSWTPGEGVLSSGSVTLTVADGGEDGATPDSEVFTITVTPVNDPPVITTTAPTTATEDVLYTYTAGVSDPDDANNGTDLIWTLSGEPAGMVVSSTGEVTWTPGEGVTTSGSVTITIADGGEDGASPDSEVFTITVTPVNDPPEILIGGVPKDSLDIFTDEDTPLLITLTVSDPEGNNIMVDSGESVNGNGTIIPDANPLAFTYLPELDFFGMETLKVYVCDDGSPVECDTLTLIATVNPINDPPVLNSSKNTLSYMESDGPLAINDQMTIQDVDNTDLNGAVITISSGYQAAEDVLGFTDQNGITGVISGNTLTLSGTATLANYETALRSITYENTSGAPDTNPRNVDFTVNDGTDDSNTFTTVIDITSVIEAPVLTGTGGVLDYTEGDGVVVIDNGIGVSDLDDTNLDLAEISISANYASGEDFLIFADQNGITGSYDSGTGVLTLTGSSSIANYQDALRSVSYENTSSNPSTLLRTVSYLVNDGDANSNVITRDINVIPVNSAPIAVDDSFTGDEDPDIPITGNILTNDSDPEGDNLVLNTSPITSPQNGIVTINPDGSISYTPDADYFGTDTFTYEVCDDGNPVLCSQADVTITINEVVDVIVFQAVSPNNDGFNDTWKIQDIQKFPNNQVRLFDRWNVLVFETEGYENDTNAWSGQSNNGVGGDQLPDGTYFYTIDLGDGSSLLKGYIVLRR